MIPHPQRPYRPPPPTRAPGHGRPALRDLPDPLWVRALGWAAVLALLIGALWILWLSVGCTRAPAGPGDAAPPDAAEPFCCKSELGCTRANDPGCDACGQHPLGCPCPANRDCHPDTLGTGWVCLPCTAGRD